uniref:ETS-related transcription factor Elf-5 n=2 Tax=Magallana gigas TaxID=29159 RepID=A0A8W8MSU6_MAGGI
MNYQKAYMNQIFSSSLMGQVAEMWRNQLLCDAIIKTGTTDTKAHRLVLVAACPMLQTMENAAIGSHLEVRLSAEIKPESVQTFLKYLYEGFMMLTGDNYKDVEKIAKLLQVESVVRCCVDFSKCLSEKTGVPCEKRFGFGENSDSVYVRSSDLLKVQETVKRHSEEETVSPEGERKRQKTNRPTPPPPLLLPMQNPTNNERVSSHGIDMSRISDTDRLMEAEYSPQVIQSSRSSTSEAEIMKDSIEIVHREPPDPNNINQSEPPVQQTMGLSVASKIPSDRNTQIVNMSNVLPHSRVSSTKNLHIQGSPHSSSSLRKPETAHSIESEPRTPDTHKNQDRRHLLTGETHSRHHIRQNSHEMPSRKHESYPSNLPCSEILGTTGLHDLSSKSICSPTVSSQPSSPYRPPIPLSHRQPNAAQMQKSFLQPMFRTGMPYDGRSFAGVPMGSLSHLAGLLPTSMAPPLPMSYNAEDSIKDHGSGPSVPSSPCTPSGPDMSIIKTEELRESEELHIDIPEESSASGATSPHNNTEEEPPGDDSSNQGSDGGSLWQDNSVKDEDESYGIVDLCGVEMAEFKCRYCISQFSDHLAIMAHFSSVHNHDFSEICPQCYKGFKSSKAHAVHDVYHLWEFIRDLLHDPKYCPRIIRWENADDGVFRVVDSAEVASLWGKTKKSTKMTYEYMSRSLRYCRTLGYFADLPKNAGYPKKLCFKFGPKAHGWHPRMDHKEQDSEPPAPPSWITMKTSQKDDEPMNLVTRKPTNQSESVHSSHENVSSLNVSEHSRIVGEHFLAAAASIEKRQKQQQTSSDDSDCTQFSHDKYQLWEFIRDLLHDPKYNPSIIQWENILDGVFRIVDSAEVARLWGKTKKFTKMTYDHMGRAFRYSKTMGYFAELPKGAGYPKKLCFKFGPKAHNWLPFPNTEAPLNLVLKPKIESRRKPTEKRSNESILEKSSGFMRRMSELNTEQMSRKAGRKSVGQERALMGMTKDTHRYGMDLGSAESIYRFQSGSDGTPFPPDRQLEMTYNIPSFIEKSEELSADILDGPKQKDQFFRERSRRASMEETVHETDSLLLLARASTAESSATSPRSSSAEKQPSFDSPEHNQK